MKTLDHQTQNSRANYRPAAFHQSGTSTPHPSREVSSGRVRPHLPQTTQISAWYMKLGLFQKSANFQKSVKIAIWVTIRMRGAKKDRPIECSGDFK